MLMVQIAAFSLVHGDPNPVLSKKIKIIKFLFVQSHGNQVTKKIIVLTNIKNYSHVLLFSKTC